MSVIKLKNYVNIVSTRLLFSRTNHLSLTLYENGYSLLPFSNKMQIFYYLFLKDLKKYKVANLSEKINAPHGFLSWKLENNGFYSSLVEFEKSRKRKLLHKKLSSIKSKTFFQPSVSFNTLPVDSRNFKSMAKAFEKYDKLYGNYSKMVEKRHAFLKTLRLKRFFNNIFMYRLFFHVAKGRKKYRSNFSYFFRRRRKVASLFYVYTLSSLKFRVSKKQRKRILNRLAWKVKKDKKWKRNKSFNLFRLRQKLSQSFYVPRHFEINYKTLSACYLGYTDFKTTNIRIPFWLNVRKLLTFLS